MHAAFASLPSHPTFTPLRSAPPAPASYNGVNGEHQAIAAELDKAQAEFREFERKDIKFRWGGPRGWVHGWWVVPDGSVAAYWVGWGGERGRHSVAWRGQQRSANAMAWRGRLTRHARLTSCSTLTPPHPPARPPARHPGRTSST